MNDNRLFDEHVKEQLSDFTAPVPTRIWKNIVAERDKRKPAGFWLSQLNNRNKLLLGALLIAFCTGGAMVYINKYYHNADSPEFVQGDKSNENSVNQQKPVPQKNISTNQSDNNEVIPTDAENADKRQTANESHSSSSPGSFKGTIYVPTLPVDEGNKNTGVKSKRNYTGLGSVLVNTTSPGLTDENPAYESQGTLLGRLTYSAQSYAALQKLRAKSTVNFKQVTYFPDCPIENDASGNKRYFEFYLGPDYAIRSLADTGNSAYLQKRKESTSYKSAFSAGVRYTKVFNNSMSVRGGVNFSQINEQFKYSQGNVVQITYIINANGDTVGNYTNTGSQYKKTTNRYRTIDIPIAIGYELGNGKWHANINAGAVVNVYSWQKGDVLDTAGRPVSITTGKAGSSRYQFKTNAGVGFIGAASVYYKLNDRMHLMAEPYYRYNFSPMNKESITVEQKYQTTGLRLGVRLDLK